MTSADQEMLEYAVSSGTYGTMTDWVENKVNRLGGGTRGKIKYFLSRLVLPMDVLKEAYPFIFRYKPLIPFFMVYRFGKGVLFSWKRIFAELKTVLRTK